MAEEIRNPSAIWAEPESGQTINPCWCWLRSFRQRRFKTLVHYGLYNCYTLHRYRTGYVECNDSQRGCFMGATFLLRRDLTVCDQQVSPARGGLSVGRSPVTVLCKLRLQEGKDTIMYHLYMHLMVNWMTLYPNVNLHKVCCYVTMLTYIKYVVMKGISGVL